MVTKNQPRYKNHYAKGLEKKVFPHLQETSSCKYSYTNQIKSFEESISTPHFYSF